MKRAMYLVIPVIALGLATPRAFAEPQAGWGGTSTGSARGTGARHGSATPRADAVTRREREIEKRDDAVSRSICQGC